MIVCDGYASLSVTTTNRGRPLSDSRRKPTTFSPSCTGAWNCNACSAMPFTRSFASTFGNPATSKMYFSG